MMQYSGPLAKRILQAAFAVAFVFLTTLTGTGAAIYVDCHVPADGDGSQANPFMYIATAVAVAEPGDVIYVLAGSYGGISISGKTNLTLVGEGDYTLMSSSITIMGCNDITLDSFDMKGVEWYGPPILSSILRIFDSSVTVKNSTLRNAAVYSPFSGAGLYCEYSSVRIENNLIKDCYGGEKGGAGYFYSCSNIEIIGNEVVDCRAWNSGGGFFVNNMPYSPSPSVVRISGNRFLNNLADFSGAIDVEASGQMSLVIDRNVIEHSGSYYSWGGAVAIDSSDPNSDIQIVNNVIAHVPDPLAQEVPRIAVFLAGSSPASVLNNIFYDNEYTVYESVGYSARASYNCTWYSAHGFYCVIQEEGNIYVDPLFVDGWGGDYYLQPDSPCIDAGHPGPEYMDGDGTRNDMGAYGGQGDVLWVLGADDGRDHEFDQSGFDLDFDVEVDPVSEFPKELNLWWYSQQYVHFDLSQDMADAGLTVKLDPAWNDGWGSLVVGIEVWDGNGWALAGEAAVNMYSPGSIQIPASLLQNGPGTLRLVALYGWGWTSVVTWDQIVISKTVPKTEVILGIDDGSDSEFDASDFNPVFDADTMTVSEFPKELNTIWWTWQEIDMTVLDDALTSGLTLTLDAMWHDGSGLLDVLVEVDDGTGFVAVGTAHVNTWTKGTVAIPPEDLGSDWVTIRLTAVSGTGGTTVVVWDQITLSVP